MWDTIKHERFKDILTLFCIYVMHRAISCCEQLVCVEKTPSCNQNLVSGYVMVNSGVFSVASWNSILMQIFKLDHKRTNLKMLFSSCHLLGPFMDSFRDRPPFQDGVSWGYQIFPLWIHKSHITSIASW